MIADEQRSEKNEMNFRLTTEIELCERCVTWKRTIRKYKFRVLIPLAIIIANEGKETAAFKSFIN